MMRASVRVLAVTTACFMPVVSKTSVHPKDFPVGPLANAKQTEVRSKGIGNTFSTKLIYKADKKTCWAGRRAAEDAGFVLSRIDRGLLVGDKMVFDKDNHALVYAYKGSNECQVTWVVED